MGKLLTRYDPFDDLFRGFFMRRADFGAAPEALMVMIDAKGQDEAFAVHAEMPGIKKENIHVSVDGFGQDASTQTGATAPVFRCRRGG